MPELTVACGEVGPELESTVDEDIRQFDEFFRTLGNASLMRQEKLIIKSYLAWKMGVFKNKQTGS